MLGQLQRLSAPQFRPPCSHFVHTFKHKTSSSAIPSARRTKENFEGEIISEFKGDTGLYAKCNDVGVQLLSRKLHSQIFSNAQFPPPSPPFIQIAKEHLEMHKLDPSKASMLRDISFTLPPLQGRNLDEHFYRLGSQAAEPWLRLGRDLANSQLSEKPECWDIQSGWTKYYYRPDGSSFSEHVPHPNHESKGEEILVFDVETLPAYSQYAILACAASKHAWYSWISPWFLGETTDPRQLIPLGDPNVPRVVVGHNVSYDRARLLEEYSLQSTKTRFLDTMALHVAVKGISSHQRPAWMKHRKSKENEQAQMAEAIQVVEDRVECFEDQQRSDSELDKRERFKTRRLELEESLSQLQVNGSEAMEVEMTSKRWEDITSVNSLLEVARLHCGIGMDKAIRSDFMTRTPEEIRENIHDYLDYCAHDVFVTHAVFAQVLPQFLKACPHPVSFAGILTMGSSFLTVDESWETYLENAESLYREMQGGVKKRFLKLAEEAKEMLQDEKWKDDLWLSQLDWTPKIAGKSRGVYGSDRHLSVQPPLDSSQLNIPLADPRPAWLIELAHAGALSPSIRRRTLPLLLKVSIKVSLATNDTYHIQYSREHGWHYIKDGQHCRLPLGGRSNVSKCHDALGKTRGAPLFKKGLLSSAVDQALLASIVSGDHSSEIADKVTELAMRISTEADVADRESDPWLRQLDWTAMATSKSNKKRREKSSAPLPPPTLWPKWYWDLAKPKKNLPPGTIEITARSRIAPLLLRLSWFGWPLFHSRQYGWIFRVPSSATFSTRHSKLEFYDPHDQQLQEMTLHGGYVFYKLPHKDGERANVGNPLGKSFVRFAQEGVLTSPGNEAKEALELNAQCSYWISARDRIINQMVVWQREQDKLGFSSGKDLGGREKKSGIILPQVITMGTVTRRAIEKTWLTASNAKKNRVGSELKAMVRAPAGYAIVGADVDSEELWISSCMGDSQFGIHGATAIGWMTLEGTRAAGTDLHSRTAAILGISREQAKVFNYSRIYGAGVRHATQLLLESNAAMSSEQARKLAENLYSLTKGKNTHRTDIFGRKFWFGGSESFVFNKLEEIALSDRPQTPALGCGVTDALSKEYLPNDFGSDYLPSRINWVVQSSGVDYLHLLIVSMEHLIMKYGIKARYLISVHDELRYLVEEGDRYRAALALQVANLWTRSLFAYKLGMNDLPQSVAFFSSVDVDHVLRKEVNLPCVTPSQSTPIPPGESLDIEQVLEKTNGGSLWMDGRLMSNLEGGNNWEGNLDGYVESDCLAHRARSAGFLKAQATQEFTEVKHLAERDSGKRYKGSAGHKRQRKNVTAKVSVTK